MLKAQTMSRNVELESYRREIDEQDRILLEALARRLDLVRELAELKKGMGWPIQDPDREKEMIKDRIARGSVIGLDGSFIVQIFDVILNHSVGLQRRLLLDLASSRDERH